MSSLKCGLAAAIAAALLSLSPMSAAQAHREHGQTYSQPATDNASPPRSNPSWPEGSPDYHGSNGG